MSENEQWEALKKWFKDNGAWIVAGIAVGALAFGGWRWWQARTDRLALEAAQRYEQVAAAFEQGDRKKGLELLNGLERNYGGSAYVDQGYLLAARVSVETNDLAKASEYLRRVMNESKDEQLQMVARLRLARVQLAQNKPDEALATLKAVEPGAFAPRFHEVRGDIYHAQGKHTAALKEYQSARLSDATRGFGADSQMLELKINDLTALMAANAAAAAPEPAAAAKTAPAAPASASELPTSTPASSPPAAKAD